MRVTLWIRQPVYALSCVQTLPQQAQLLRLAEQSIRDPNVFSLVVSHQLPHTDIHQQTCRHP